jgi:menaquinol-cytochrome c reductase iron-sulfur subunit
LNPPEGHTATASSSRRDFCAGAACIAAGAALGAVPLGAGLATWLDPLRRRQGGMTAPVKVATLDALPADGTPRKVTVRADLTDAWNKDTDTPVGAAYLRRTGPRVVEALNVVCPHAGCFVDYLPARGCFFCPCHNSAFALDGRVSDPSSPSPRPLDSLEVELRGEEVWLHFQNFQSGIHEKVPLG